MSPTMLFPIAGVITLICAWLVWDCVWKSTQCNSCNISVLLSLSIILSLIGLIRLEPVTAHGIDFKLAASVAICTILVQDIYLVGMIKHGVKGLGLFLLPASAIPLLLIPLLPAEPSVSIQTTSLLETSHLLISLLAYAILTLATLHAIMHLMLDRALKRKRLGRLMQVLPSLLEIEKHMYAQIRLSAWLLGIGILTGLSWQWVEHSRFILVSHKVILALFSWVVLIALLFMRRTAAWPGRRASFMVLAAYILLLLAYFGVKLIQSWRQ